MRLAIGTITCNGNITGAGRWGRAMGSDGLGSHSGGQGLRPYIGRRSTPIGNMRVSIWPIRRAGIGGYLTGSLREVILCFIDILRNIRQNKTIIFK